MKSKWLSELKKIGFLRLGLLAVAAIILIICSLPQNQLSNLSTVLAMLSIMMHLSMERLRLYLLRTTEFQMLR